MTIGDVSGETTIMMTDGVDNVAEAHVETGVTESPMGGTKVPAAGIEVESGIATTGDETEAKIETVVGGTIEGMTVETTVAAETEESPSSFSDSVQHDMPFGSAQRQKK